MRAFASKPIRRSTRTTWVLLVAMILVGTSVLVVATQPTKTLFTTDSRATAVLTPLASNLTGPLGRIGPIFVYDPPTGAFVMFGGHRSQAGVGGTWEYKAGRWTNLSLTTMPPPRSLASAVYDPTLGGVLMFGGNGGPFPSYLNDTWLFKNGSWTDLTPNLVGHRSPSATYGAGFTYDAKDGYALLFGGMLASGYSNSTWAFRNNTWFQPSCVGAGCHAPIPMVGPSLTYDPSIQRVVLYGGYGYPPHAFATQLNGTYRFLNGNWSPAIHATPRHSPGGLYEQSTQWDPSCQCLVMFGGINGVAHPTDHTWEYVNFTWIPVLTPSPPPGMYMEQLAYDPTSHSMILFGGELFNNIPNSHLWVFAGGSWTKL
ncbi:MAG: hypothetical protein L3K18_01355 [Thermoplasmata archaeon]|nr:hypothetical protein [Thermoplasmata archaeon]